jgi:hypothetical protein
VLWLQVALAACLAVVLANVGQMVGIPGMEQGQMMQLAAQQALDPESYGSSNSPGARYKAPTMQYM